VALPKIGFNEGSLLRRTLLFVGTFLVGSVAFIGLVSFALVSIARGLVAPPHAEGSTSGALDSEVETAASGAPRVAKPPLVKVPSRGRRTPAGAAQPAQDD
jgi:hypothetical protein